MRRVLESFSIVNPIKLNLALVSTDDLLRDNNENWINGFSHKLDITNFLAAELWGIRDELLFARDLNIRKLIVESDVKSVVELLKLVASDIFGSHPYSALINDCRFLIQCFDEVTIQHAHQESNFCLNISAKERHNLTEPFYEFSFPPYFVVNQLLMDIWRVSYPRML